MIFLNSELTVSGSWADRERTVSGPSADRQRTVSGPSADRDGNSALHCNLLFLRIPLPTFITEEKCDLKPLNPENGGNMFLRSVDANLQHYTMPKPRRLQSGLLQVDSWRSDARLHYSGDFFVQFILISEASTRATALPKISGLNKTVDLPTQAKQCVTDRQASYLEQKRTQCQFVKKSIRLIARITITIIIIIIITHHPISCGW